MGKWLDRTALTILIAAALYLLFLSAFGNILVAACMSFLCCALLFHRFRGKSERMTRAQAKATLNAWAFGSDDETRMHIEHLTESVKPHAKLVYLPKHPSASISISDVFGAWKSARGQGHLIVAAPCSSDSRARTFARTLQQPTAEILDAPKLIPLIRRAGIKIAKEPQRQTTFQRLQRLLAELPARRPWYKNVLSGMALMLLYLFSGNTGYLALSILLLFLAGVSIRAHA